MVSLLHIAWIAPREGGKGLQLWCGVNGSLTQSEIKLKRTIPMETVLLHCEESFLTYDFLLTRDPRRIIQTSFSFLSGLRTNLFEERMLHACSTLYQKLCGALLVVATEAKILELLVGGSKTRSRDKPQYNIV